MSLPHSFLSGKGGGGGVAVTGPAFLEVAPTEGRLVLGGYGFEAWAAGGGNSQEVSFDFVVPATITKIRAIFIGGGGGSAGSTNVVGGVAGAGLEVFIDVTPGETLNCAVGMGGQGWDNTPLGYAGGDSWIQRNGSFLSKVNGGQGAVASPDPTTRNTGWFYNYTGTTLISTGAGGGGGTSQQLAHGAVGTIALSGATAHAPAASSWYIAEPEGIGFGGGGGTNGTWNAGTGTRGAGGIYGDAGVFGTQLAADDYTNTTLHGPVAGRASETGGTSGVGSGPGGGSFGAAGADGFAGGWGAGGLVRIWWAGSGGDVTWINSGGNYV